MKVKYRIVLVVSLIILSILSYKLSHEKINSDVSLPKPKLSYNLHRDIVYKNTPENTPLKLDIYQPKHTNGKKLPVVIYIHGGAWSVGNKEMIMHKFRAYILNQLLQNQYTVISADFTNIDSQNHLDRSLQDIKDVLKWVKNNEGIYNMDSENIGIWGGSSGAHLAMLTAYKQNDDKSQDLPLLSYVVNLYGPTDLNELFRTDAHSAILKWFKFYYPKTYKTRNKKIMQLTGFDINNQKDKVIQRCKELSPANYITKNTVPTLIFHGNEDNVVDIRQSEHLVEKLKENKINHQYFVVDNANHTFNNISLEDANDIAQKTVNFIKHYTKKQE